MVVPEHVAARPAYEGVAAVGGPVHVVEVAGDGRGYHRAALEGDLGHMPAPADHQAVVALGAPRDGREVHPGVEGPVGPGAGLVVHHDSPVAAHVEPVPVGVVPHAGPEGAVVGRAHVGEGVAVP